MQNLLYWKSTIDTTIAAIEANNDMYCLQKRTEKFPLQVTDPCFEEVNFEKDLNQVQL